MVQVFLAGYAVGILPAPDIVFQGLDGISFLLADEVFKPVDLGEVLHRGNASRLFPCLGKIERGPFQIPCIDIGPYK